GLDQSGDGPRPLAIVQRKFGLKSDEDVRHLVSGVFHDLYALGLPRQVDFRWTRNKIRALVDGQPAAKPTAGPPKVERVEPSPTTGALTGALNIEDRRRLAAQHLMRAREAAVNRCPDHTERLRELFLSVGLLDLKQQELWLALYGCDDQSFAPRRYGQLVERFRLKGETEVEERIRQAWDAMYRGGLDRTISDRWLRGILNQVRSIAPPATSNAAQPSPPVLTVVRGQPAAPSPAAPETTVAGKPIVFDQSRFSEILGLCQTDDQRQTIATVIRALEHCSAGDRAHLLAAFGLANGARPLMAEEMASGSGVSASAMSMRTKAALGRAQRYGLDPSLDGPTLRSLVCGLRGIRRKGVRPDTSLLSASGSKTTGESAATSPAPPTPTADGGTASPAASTAQPSAAEVPSATTSVASSGQIVPELQRIPKLFSQLDMERRFWRWLHRLPLRDQAVVRAYYRGLTGTGPNTIAEIAQIFEFPVERDILEMLDRIRRQFTAYLGRRQPKGG
ncbi:MAG: hypothetical protein HY421_01010, partial [Candidatus Kerfeldbacteria bacterium]|nr:hypothetical protein [Candidatus Kerfeldbacteria bacterium]